MTEKLEEGKTRENQIFSLTYSRIFIFIREVFFFLLLSYIFQFKEEVVIQIQIEL